MVKTPVGLLLLGVLALSLFYNVGVMLGNTVADLNMHVNNNNGASLPGDNHDRLTYEVPQYTFPTVEERFEYYMGSWYNKTDWKITDCPSMVKIDNIPEDTMSSLGHKDHIFSLATLKACTHIKTTYCGDAYEILKRGSNDGGDNTLAMFHFGDTHTNYTKLPVVSKSRPALNRYQHSPIIWPLDMGRHYEPIEKYYNLVKKKGNEIPWEDKESKVFWRGSTTGDRVQQLNHWLQYDANIIDIGFHRIGSGYFENVDFYGRYLESHHVRPKTQITEMSKYKYLLSVEGNDVATGLKWSLYTNSVVLMSPPTKATWAMEDLLLPFVHYIPLEHDYSNLLEMLEWAEQHQEACQEISKRATDYVKRIWLSKQAQIDYDILRKRLATAYVDQFQQQLSQCGESGPSIVRGVVDKTTNKMFTWMG